MTAQEFNEAVGKIVGVKSGIRYAHVIKAMSTGEVTVRLEIKPNEAQIKKLIPLLMNHKSKSSSKTIGKF